MSSPDESGARPSGRRSSLALPWAMIALGIAGIVWGVLHVSSAAYGTRARSVEERRSYDQIKQSVHASYLGGLARGLAGLALAAGGERLRRRRGRGPRGIGG